MADSRRTRDYQPDAPLDLEYLNDPRYTPLDQIGGPGLGGAGNSSGLDPRQQELLGGIDQRLATIQQLGDQRKGLEDQINALPPQLKTSYGLDLSGVGNALSGIGSAVGRGLSALIPSQDTLNSVGMRLQNMGAAYTGQTPLYMKQIQQQMDLAQHQDLMGMRRQQLQQQIQQHQQALQEKQWDRVFQVMTNDKLSPPQAMKMLQYEAQTNPFAASAAQSVNEKMLGKFRTYEKFLPRSPEEYAAGLKNESMNWDTISADLDVAESTAKEEAKSLATENAQQKKMQGLIDKLHADPTTLTETELNLLDKYNTAQKERALKIQQLQGDLTKQGIDRRAAETDLAAKEIMPREAASYPLPGGKQATEIYRPSSQSMERIVGDKPPASVTNVNMKQESAFEGELGKQNVKEIKDTQAGARDAATIIRNIHQGKQLLDSGMITGVGAEYITKFGQALQQLGFNKGKDAVSNTQAYAALMASNVAKHIKEFGAGTGLSDADREYATRMAGGDITLDEKSLRKILDMNETASRNIIKAHNKSVKGIKSMIPLTIEEPPEYTSQKPSTQPQSAPQVGEIRPGKSGSYRFKGGNPRDKSNWELVK